MAAAPVVHFEIEGKDGNKLMEFYGELFEWKVDANNPMNYGMVDNGGNGINGGIGTSQNGQPWCGFYVSVPDCQAALDKAESLGGKTIMPPMKMEGYGLTLAMFADPEGNQVGLVTGM
ncbi:MAG TPA: VOC family protein [Chloroflexota bacterium]|nr:VOC family protein [Chloroflexota bacterium]